MVNPEAGCPCVSVNVPDFSSWLVAATDLTEIDMSELAEVQSVAGVLCPLA
jgi:hypothetical protein